GSELHWKLAYLARRPGWEGKALLVGSAGPGTYQAYLPELGLETRLRLGPDRSLDEELRVRLARVDLGSLEASFEELR
ncbi:MAG TPA: hypothetical protein PLB91_16250, partial [Spirochaetales bacterium]|nr:hypothetical protein [Spirochaetales bacterium]